MILFLHCVWNVQSTFGSLKYQQAFICDDSAGTRLRITEVIKPFIKSREETTQENKFRPGTNIASTFLMLRLLTKIMFVKAATQRQDHQVAHVWERRLLNQNQMSQWQSQHFHQERILFFLMLTWNTIHLFTRTTHYYSQCSEGKKWKNSFSSGN